jgi:hypothetical protein
MNKFNFTIISGLVLSLMSCSMSKSNRTVSSPHIKIEEPVIIATPLMADMSISTEKISGKATMGFTPGMPSPIEECKSTAVGNALVSGSADVLIEPFYIIETTDNTVTVEVTGFPAKYKNFRKDEEKMKELTNAPNTLNTVSVSSMESGDPIAKAKRDQSKNSAENNQRTRKVAGAIAAVLGLLTSLLLVALASA